MVDPQQVLPAEGWVVFQSLNLPAITQDFYLAGGTGLALHLGHRISVDFDLFSAKNELTPFDRASLLDALRDRSADLTILMDKDGTLSVRWQDVNVTFFCYPYPLLESLTVIGGVPIASPADIAAMKLAAIVGRGSKKDFVDLYFLMQQQPLKHWLDQATDKFREMRDFRALSLHALSYFADADAEPMPEMLHPVEWDKVKEHIQHEVRQLGRRYYRLGEQ